MLWIFKPRDCQMVPISKALQVIRSAELVQGKSKKRDVDNRSVMPIPLICSLNLLEQNFILPVNASVWFPPQKADFTGTPSVTFRGEVMLVRLSGSPNFPDSHSPHVYKAPLSRNTRPPVKIILWLITMNAFSWLQTQICWNAI